MWDPDQVLHVVLSDLGPNCFKGYLEKTVNTGISHFKSLLYV